MDIPRHNLQMWPGYTSNVKYLHDGIFLNVDCATKFIQKGSIYDLIKDLKSQNYSPADVLEELVPKDPELKRCVVITLYNSKIYQLDGIDFKLTPKTHTFKWRETNPQTREITEHNTDMVRYMDIKYGIKIPERDQNQPLLIVHERDQVIYLIPSLCNQASLPKNFTSDSRKMKDLQDYKLSNPNQRYDRINTLIERIQQTDVLD